MTDYRRSLALLHQAIDQGACEAVGGYGLFALTSVLIPGKLMMKVINAPGSTVLSPYLLYITGYNIYLYYSHTAVRFDIIHNFRLQVQMSPWSCHHSVIFVVLAHLHVAFTRNEWMIYRCLACVNRFPLSWATVETSQQQQQQKQHFCNPIQHACSTDRAQIFQR